MVRFIEKRVKQTPGNFVRPRNSRTRDRKGPQERNFATFHLIRRRATRHGVIPLHRQQVLVLLLLWPFYAITCRIYGVGHF